MLLENKVAVIYGGGGRIGAGVARAFGREGARIFLEGRTAETLNRVAALTEVQRPTRPRMNREWRSRQIFCGR